MDNPQATEAELGWLAGILDGEGSVLVHRTNPNKSRKKTYYSTRVIVVANTDTTIIDAAVDILKKLGIGHYVQLNSQSSRKPLYTVRVERFISVGKLLNLLIPHIRGEKKFKAMLLKRFVDSRARNGTNIEGNTFKRVPYTDEEAKLGEALLHWSLNDQTRDLIPEGGFTGPQRAKMIESSPTGNAGDAATAA